MLVSTSENLPPRKPSAPCRPPTAAAWLRAAPTNLRGHDLESAEAQSRDTDGRHRRHAYAAYREAWAAGRGVAVPRAKEIDRLLHSERIFQGTHCRRLHASNWPELPAGVFMCCMASRLLCSTTSWCRGRPRDNAHARARPEDGAVDVITPPSSVAAFRAGYQPQVDSTALTSEEAADVND